MELFKQLPCRFSLTERVVVLICLCVCGIYGVVSQDTFYPGPNSDSMIYIFQAAWYSGEGPDWYYDHIRGYTFPPGYPLWLRLFGASPETAKAAVVANTAAMFLAVGAFGFLLIRVRLRVTYCLVVLVVSFLSYRFFAESRSVGSETLFMALAFAALAMLADGVRGMSRERLMVAALLVVGSYFTRSIGVVLVVLFVVHLLHARRFDGLVWAMIVVPIAFWKILSGFLFEAYESYSDVFFSQDPLNNLFSWVAVNLREMTRSMAALLGMHSSTGVVALIAIATFVVPQALRGRILAQFLVGYFAIIAVWPYPTHMTRFLMPVWPLLVLSIFSGLQSLKVGPDRIRATICLGFFSIFLTLNAFRYVDLAGYSMPGELEQYRFTLPIMSQNTEADALRFADHLHRGIMTAQAVSEFVPPDQCVSSIVPQFVSFYSDRRVSRIVFKDSHDVAMRKIGVCPYVFVFGFFSDTWKGSILYPTDHPLEEKKFRPILVAQLEDGTIVAALMEFKKKGP